LRHGLTVAKNAVVGCRNKCLSCTVISKHSASRRRCLPLRGFLPCTQQFSRCRSLAGSSMLFSPR